MPLANQYGIDMGNILSTVSNLKTAQQNREIGDIRKNALQRQSEKEIATDTAEQQYLKDPTKASAATIAQKLQWDQLDQQQRNNAAQNIKAHLNQVGTTLSSIANMQDPNQQSQALEQSIASLSPEEQKHVMQTYGATPQQRLQNLPRMLNDTIVNYNGIDYLTKEKEIKDKYKHEIDLAKIKAENELKKKQIGGKPTKFDQSINAIMAKNKGMTRDDAIYAYYASEKNTQVEDPIYGTKTVSTKTKLPTPEEETIPETERPSKEQVILMAKERNKDVNAALQAFGY